MKPKHSHLIGNKNRLTHGLTKSPEYWIWRSMKARCFNPKTHSYKSYGGRGITVCKKWVNSFENFYKDIGPRPNSTYQIDRINNNGNYSPKNCRWVTASENSSNRRTSKMITFNGKTLSATEWAKRIGMNRGGITKRLQKGWPLKKALTTPPLARHLRIKVTHKIVSNAKR